MPGSGLRRGAILLLAILLHGCLPRQPVPERPTSRPPSPSTPDQAEWVLPAEKEKWDRPDRLAVLSLPPDADPDSLRIHLNGDEVTEPFLPVSLFRRPWRRSAARLVAVAATAPEALNPETQAADEMDDPTLSGGASRRAVALLGEDRLKRGRNRLLAEFRDGTGEERTLQRRFRYRPRGRRIHLLVSRESRRGVDDHASARVLFVPLDGAAPVDLSEGTSADLASRPGATARSWVFARGGEATVYLPDGGYRAVATGGPLDSLEEWEVPERSGAEHRFHLRREVDLPNTATVDFHVHAATSRDSLVPLEERLWSFVAAGVDVMVASDHGDITDYRPLIGRLEGARGRIQSVPGVEAGFLKTRTGEGSLGHWNVWPLEPDPKAEATEPGRRSGHGGLVIPRRGSPAEMQKGKAVPLMFDAYRRQARELARRAGLPAPDVDPVVIQLNHPRGLHFRPGEEPVGRGHDWFNKAGFDPAAPIPAAGMADGSNAGLLDATEEGTTALDFDALEIWNRSSRRLYLEVRRDWFSLLNQGYVRTATADTDTHTLSPELAGYPMNVVFLGEGSPDGFEVRVSDLAAAVRAGRLVGTDGPVPLLTVRSGEAVGRPGDLVPAADGRLHVQVDVLAASWVPVGSIRIWGNGALLGEERTTGPRRAVFDVAVERDAWLIAEVGDPEAHPDGTVLPGPYGLIAPRGLALAYTNPVFIDTDGNGRFDPPGLKNSTLPSLPAMAETSGGRAAAPR